MALMQRIFVAVFAALLGAFAAGTAAAQDSQLSGLIISPEFESRRLAEEGNWGALEQAAAAWSEQDGTDWQSWYYYGLAELRQGKANMAVPHLILAKELSPSSNLTLEMLLADAHAQVPNWQSAEKAYRRLLTEHENNPELWDRLRDLLERFLASLPQPARDTGEVAQNIRAELTTVLQTVVAFRGYHDKPELWRRLADLQRAQQDDAAARKSYMRFLALQPRELPVWEWVFRHDLENADASTLEKTVSYMKKVDRNNPLLRVYLGQQAQAEQNKSEARHHYELVIIHPEYPYQRAQALAGLGDLTESKNHGEALEYYKRAIQADPSYLPAWEHIVVILRAQKQRELARKYFSHLRQVKRYVQQGQPVPRKVLHGLEPKQE